MSRRTEIGTARHIVLAAGSHGRHTFRIPAVVESGGSMVLFAEGRTDSASDTGEIAVVGCGSNDGGRTWSAPATLAETAGYTCGNPVPVELQDGRIVLLSCRNGAGVGEFELKGPDVPPSQTRRVFRQFVTVPGLEASEPEDITDAVKPPHWGWYATGPGHGLRLVRGPHRGRLVVPCCHSDTRTVTAQTSREDRRRTFAVHGLISDDDGVTWRIGYSDPGGPGFSGPNESTAAELTGGDVVISTRNGVQGDVATRGQARSRDGAESLSGQVVPQPELIMVPISCSVINTTVDGREILIMSGLSEPDKRAGMALRFSADGGEQWTAPLVIDSGPSAYSDLCMTADGSLHIVWESGVERPTETIVHTVVTHDHLEQIAVVAGSRTSQEKTMEG